MITRIIILQRYAFWHWFWYVHLPTITLQPGETLPTNYTIHGWERALCHLSLPYPIEQSPDSETEVCECICSQATLPLTVHRAPHTVGAGGMTAEQLNYVFHPRCRECAVASEKVHSNTKQLNWVVEPLLWFVPSLASTRLLCLDVWWALPPSGLTPCPDPKDSDNALSINQPKYYFCCGLLVFLQ